MDLQLQEEIASVDADGEAQNESESMMQTVFDSNPGKRADVWKEFVSVGIEEDGKERGRCIHCSKKMVIDKGQGTSTLRRHVRSCLNKKQPLTKRGGGGHDDRPGTSLPVLPSCDRDEVTNIPSKKRQRSEGKTGSAMLLGLDILDCPVCFNALTIPIFQCDNGHLACSSCCPKLSNKCPTCACPIGSNRCRAMESVLESVFIPCPNATFGCTKTVSYAKQPSHQLECAFSQCSCPALDCNFTGSSNQICSHFFADDHPHKPKSLSFLCGGSVVVQMNMAGNEMLVLCEFKKKLLFVLQCFREGNGAGVYVTVRCIAPSAPEAEKFPYCLDYSMDGHTLTYKSPDVKKVLEVTSQIPHDSFMFLPHCLLSGELLEIKLCIGLKDQTMMEDMHTNAMTREDSNPSILLKEKHCDGPNLYFETLTSKSFHLPDNDEATSSVLELLQKIKEEE